MSPLGFCAQLLQIVVLADGLSDYSASTNLPENDNLTTEATASRWPRPQPTMESMTTATTTQGDLRVYPATSPYLTISNPRECTFKGSLRNLSDLANCDVVKDLVIDDRTLIDDLPENHRIKTISGCLSIVGSEKLRRIDFLLQTRCQNCGLGVCRHRINNNSMLCITEKLMTSLQRNFAGIKINSRPENCRQSCPGGRLDNAYYTEFLRGRRCTIVDGDLLIVNLTKPAIEVRNNVDLKFLSFPRLKSLVSRHSPKVLIDNNEDFDSSLLISQLVAANVARDQIVEYRVVDNAGLTFLVSLACVLIFCCLIGFCWLIIFLLRGCTDSNRKKVDMPNPTFVSCEQPESPHPQVKSASSRSHSQSLEANNNNNPKANVKARSSQKPSV